MRSAGAARAATTARAAALGLALLLSWACGPANDGSGEGQGSGAQTGARPSVLLIVVDTLRADHLGSYGYDLPTSPHIDALAARGVVFEDCAAGSSWTLLSMVSLMTGQPLFADVWRVPERFPLLAERFADAGYRTGAVVANSVLSQEAGFDRGFERYEVRERRRPQWDAVEVTDRALAFLGQRPSDTGADAGADAGTDTGADAGADTGADAAAGTGTSPAAGTAAGEPEPPFLLWVHYLDPHHPYAPPERPWERSPEQLFDGPTLQLVEQTRAALPQAERAALVGDVDDLARDVDGYDGEIAALDAQIGRLLAALEVSGRLEHTLIVLASDHGESLYTRAEHPARVAQLREYHARRGEPPRLTDFVKGGHDHWLYEELLHTPLILAGPGLPRGRRVPGLVRNLELRPTLLGLAGLPVDGAGRDLSAALRDGTPVPPAPFATAATSQGVSVRLPDGTKLWLPSEASTAAYGLEPQLFDLTTDPLERAPQPAADDAQGVELLRRLRALQAADPFAEYQGLDADEETLQRLREMGYLR